MYYILFACDFNLEFATVLYICICSRSRKKKVVHTSRQLTEVSEALFGGVESAGLQNLQCNLIKISPLELNRKPEDALCGMNMRKSIYNTFTFYISSSGRKRVLCILRNKDANNCIVKLL